MIALPTGDSLESLWSAGSASAEPTSAYCRTSRLHVLQGDLGADADHVGADAVGVDDDRAAQLILQRVDARLEHGLLVLGVVELGVLGDVAEVTRSADALRYLVALDAREVLDLFLEAPEALRREHDLAVDHWFFLFYTATRPRTGTARRTRQRV